MTDLAPDLVVLHRIPHSVTPLDDWLAEVADRVTLITSVESEPGYAGRFPRVVGVPDYAEGPGVPQAIDAACRGGEVSTLVHVTEDDVLRAAAARDRYDLPGPRHADVLPWRDKLRMKERVAAAGLPTPAFAGPDADLAAFAAAHGFPLVVKPRFGFSSHGVAVVRDAAALAAEVARRDPADVLVEEFVPGEVHHVDGFARAGETLHVLPSRYLNGCLAFQDGEPLGSVQLDAGDELVPRLAALTRAVVAALPPLDFCPYHLEVFRRPDGELVFCEIACRLGGAHIMESFTRTTGVNPARLWIRDQLGLADGPGTPIAAGERRHGWLLVPPRRGRLLDLRHPGADRPDFLTDFVVKTPVPRDFDGAHGSTDSIIGYVVEGTDSMDVEKNLQACLDLTEHLTRWAA
ncbi:acetyl-CoA carboxylase biotin carboxylase subunit family protein [Pseudonocardia sp. WMMC193]|uniref:ATP-grasp domain-containing protein n=1 Tax=Pseudonocardia sp. WMMC193 TaxID=2911965 RepID=UPI001F488784|nr:ATP-grasp domain-containing protein [Pseudonocardia sp. WMMC193]MCF7551754.1 ATP-grasp domain-containing protein [Pseudonocardia sp. WMMC193]